MQVHLNDKQIVDKAGNEHIPIVDELVAKLPVVNGRPYLSCFALTHPDLDHCRGFADYSNAPTSANSGTPRIFREYEDTYELSADAQDFRAEAHRRAERSIEAGGDPGSGDRVRIIGYSEWFQEGERY